MAHLHNIYDTDLHFLIDPATREITNQSKSKVSVVQYDHNSERFTFEIPRYVEGHDMSLSNRVKVHYLNLDANNENPGVYDVYDTQISPDSNDVVICSWLISRNATQLAGNLNFAIEFACVNGEAVDYSWHTAIFKGIIVSNGINNSEAVVEPYADVLEQWYHSLFTANDDAVTNIAEAKALAIAEIEAEAENKAAEVLSSIPDDYITLAENTAPPIVCHVSGDIISIADSADRKLKGLTLYGKSTQDGTPTPEAPVEIKSVENPVVTVCKKNLLPIKNKATTYAGATYTPQDDGTVVVTGTVNADEDSVFHLVKKDDPIILPKGEYLFSGTEDGSDKTYRMLIYGTDWTFFATNKDEAARFSLDKETEIFVYIWVARGTAINKVFYPMIRKASIEDDTFEPYVAKSTITVPHALRGIPVSDGGNYTDDNGQQWICDEVDYARGVYVQRVKSVEYDGSDDEAWWRYTSTGYEGFGMTVTDLMVGTRLNGYCNRFPVHTDGTLGAGVWLGANNDIIYMHNMAEVAADLESWRAWLSQNPTVVVYALATPVETPLSDALSLRSNYHHTTVLNDGGAGMAVDYIADTKIYIDNKLSGV